jgi:hypothetical protein
MDTKQNQVTYTLREETLFAGVRKPIKSREEVFPRIAELTRICGEHAVGPLHHIVRYDTPVDGFDSEIGYPVSQPISEGEVVSHMLRRLPFFGLMHHGPLETFRETKLELIKHINRTGLALELEEMEIYHNLEQDNPENNVVETRFSFLAWPEIYKQQLVRVLGAGLAEEIWKGGGSITPFTLVDERAAWVAASLERLKAHTNVDQQFEILSRVALVRPAEDIEKFKQIYEESGDPNQIIAIQDEELRKTRTGGFIDPQWFDGKVLHCSKVSYNREAYEAATNHDELRKAYCFCTLIREAQAPQVDPIFCYRAAGWSRQFWEPILGVEFERCIITHSVLKGDPFCAWDFHMPERN